MKISSEFFHAQLKLVQQQQQLQWEEKVYHMHNTSSCVVLGRSGSGSEGVDQIELERIHTRGVWQKARM